MRAFLRILGVLIAAPFFMPTASAQIGTVTVTVQSQTVGSTAAPQTLKAVIVGCAQGAVPMYQGAPISVTPNQPGSTFILTSGNSVTVTLPGNDQILCSGQNYTTYALTWYSALNAPEGPTQDFRFTEGQTFNTGAMQPIRFIPPTLNNVSGVLCPSGKMLTGFQPNFQPICTAIPFTSAICGDSTTSHCINVGLDTLKYPADVTLNSAATVEVSGQWNFNNLYTSGVAIFGNGMNAPNGATFGGLVQGPDPTTPTSFVTKEYVDGVVSSGTGGTGTGTVTPFTGGTLTTPLILARSPQSLMEAATKGYVDLSISALPALTGQIGVPLYGTSILSSFPRIELGADRATYNYPYELYGHGQTLLVDEQANQSVLQMAINQAETYAAMPPGSSPQITGQPDVYIAPGVYYISGTLDLPNDVHLTGDSSVGVTLIETDPTAPLIRVRSGHSCSSYSCYGGLEHLTLEGSSYNNAGVTAYTTGSLLEMDTGFFNLRDVHFFNSVGRGLQMNNSSERVFSYNLSFYDVRWPIVMAGDSNEDYFYSTNILEAGEIQAGGYNLNRLCFGTNCVNGNFQTTGTVYQDTHAAIYVDKAVNVAFYGGTNKSSLVVGGAKVYRGGNIRFQDFYHENSYYGPVAATPSYIVGGKSEQTYLTGTLSGTGLSVAVNDATWMPQYLGSIADLATSDWFSYVLLPQDFDPTQSTPSAYATGVNKNQYEIINIAGFVSDGNLYIQSTGRNQQYSTAPSGTAWPAGTIVQQWAGLYGEQGHVLLSQIHSNTIQGNLSNTSSPYNWTLNCDQTTYLACGEFIFGYQPDVVSLTSNPATNLNGFYRPLGSVGNPLPALGVSVTLDNPDIGNNGPNPYVGMISTNNHVSLAVHKPGGNLQSLDTVAATTITSNAMQLSLQWIGGSTVYAPQYSTGTIADVQLTNPEAGEIWNTNGLFEKLFQAYKPYQQYGNFTSGIQFANVFCPAMDQNTNTSSNQSTSRFCVMGGPSNTSTSSNSPGYGFGAEWDYWNGTAWQQEMRAWAGGLFTQGAFTAATINNEITVDGHTYTNLNAAWTAATTLAQGGAGSQTIRLGAGTYPITATLTEPTNGACVSIIGTSGTSSGADINNLDTTLKVTAALSGPVISLGNTALTEGCTFKGFNVLGQSNATNGFAMQWYRGLTVEDVSVNDTTSTGILLGESTGAHQSIGADLRNVTVSYSSGSFTPATRPGYGVIAQTTAIDSFWDTGVVRNAQIAAFQNNGGGWRVAKLHGFGYPYTCTTAPCSNTASSSSAANASFATNYVVEDNGTGGNVYSDTYMDSPAIAAFHLQQNGVVINGGHLYWPDQTSFPAANLAYVESTMNSNLVIANIACVNMATTAGAGLEAGAGVWISFQGTGQLPPTYSSVANLSGCGAFYQQRVGASQTAFARGATNMNNTNPGLALGQNPKVLADPLGSASNYVSYSAQNYTGYTADFYEGHFSGQPSAFNITADGSVRTSGGLMYGTAIVTAGQTLSTANHTILANATSAAFTLTLPNCQAYMNDGMRPTGLELDIVKTDTSANAITLATSSSQTINYAGATASTLTLSTAAKRTVVCGPDYNWYAY